MTDLCTIGELTERVGWVLRQTGADRQSSARVRAVPDTRTLRYYTTLGLLDAPVEFRGRTALYGRRHLVQAVAIKRLQADGATLVDVQRRLVGAGSEQLEEWAAIPDSAWGSSPPQTSSGPASDEASAPEPLSAAPQAFWSAEPVVMAKRIEPEHRSSEPPAGQWAMHWQVAAGVRLVWDDASELSGPTGLTPSASEELSTALAALRRAVAAIRAGDPDQDPDGEADGDMVA